MAELIQGKAVVWGLTSGATATGLGAFLPQSGDFNVESDSVEVRDGVGEVIGIVHYNQRQTMTMEVIPAPTATPGTIADARLANILPPPGTVVTVTDTTDPEIAGTNAGKYIFVRGSKKKSNTDITKLTFELVQWVAHDVAVAVV